VSGSATDTLVGPFGHHLGEAPRSDPDDVTAAVDRVRTVQRRWADTSVQQRAALLLRLHDVVLQHREEILDLLQREVGKARVDAFEELVDVCSVARHYGRRGPSYLQPQRFRGLVPALMVADCAHYPHGVVGVIAPWNYPLVLTLGEIIPALLAGNGVVVKPDEQCVFSARLGVRLVSLAGVPSGLVEVVVGGAETGQALVEQVDHVVFTGSTAAGREVGAAAARRLVGSTLELGGKNTMIVRADADLGRAAAGAVRGAFANAGQLCLAVSRVAVHADVAEPFTAALLARVAALRLGNTLDYSYDVGSLANAAQFARVRRHLDDAVARGARLLAGGGQRAELGPFMHEPTVLTDLPREALAYREETFGPLLNLVVVADDEEAVSLANDTEAGLTGSIWTADRGAARSLAARMQTGSVTINESYQAIWGSTAAAFGGVKASGLGRRHGAEGVRSLTRTQTVVEQRGARVGVDLGSVLSLPATRWTRGFTAALALARRTGLS
jgi:succinate-semialdehyde dehydrogenase/glutarate-semialdehyde dehydrogenase